MKKEIDSIFKLYKFIFLHKIFDFGFYRTIKTFNFLVIIHFKTLMDSESISYKGFSLKKGGNSIFYVVLIIYVQPYQKIGFLRSLLNDVFLSRTFK